MKRAIVVAVLASTLTGCNNLGLGEADCTPPERSVSAATVLNVQAVPSAKYTPCLDELRLGWDEVQWFFQNGSAGMEIIHSFEPFLKVTVTESCDVSGADHVESQPPDVRITIVPAGEGPLLRARLHVDDLTGTEIEDRKVTFTIDERIEEPIRARANLALLRDEYVWIIDELDAEEGTLELRSEGPALAARGVTPEEALELIGENLPDVFYRGDWYFTFEGGCITYAFDAAGTVAETVADDADDAIGFFPADELRELARREGYDVGS